MSFRNFSQYEFNADDFQTPTHRIISKTTAMQSKTFGVAESSYRSAGWIAIASGVIGLLAYGALAGFLMARN